MGNLFKILFLPFISTLLFSSCNNDDDIGLTNQITFLSDVIAEQPIELSDVIACASGSENPNEVIIYVYPRPGVSDLRYFETTSVAVNPNDFSLYQEVIVEPEDFFNNHIVSITRETDEEKWVIATFLENDVLSVSNPIRLKHQSQNTIFTDEITINQSQSTMPNFLWDNLSDESNVIYFQVVSDQQNNLLSGTYTLEEQFQYYLLDNVVLNVTETTPPNLIVNQDYTFTLMGVSLDNWVNVLGKRVFTAD